MCIKKSSDWSQWCIPLLLTWSQPGHCPSVLWQIVIVSIYPGVLTVFFLSPFWLRHLIYYVSDTNLFIECSNTTFTTSVYFPLLLSLGSLSAPSASPLSPGMLSFIEQPSQVLLPLIIYCISYYVSLCFTYERDHSMSVSLLINFTQPPNFIHLTVNCIIPYFLTNKQYSFVNFLQC